MFTRLIEPKNKGILLLIVNEIVCDPLLTIYLNCKRQTHLFIQVYQTYTGKIIKCILCLGDSFVYRLVNRALRTGDPDLIHPYRFFINDLYTKLLSIDRNEVEDFEDLVVYRGQGLTQPELTYLQHYVGQLLTLSSFTSTTVDRALALLFVSPRENVAPVLFEFQLNSTLSNTRPYSYIASYSAMPDEYEVLVSVGTIFRLNSVTWNDVDGVWLVCLQICPLHSHDFKDLMKEKPSQNLFQPESSCPLPPYYNYAFHNTMEELKSGSFSRRSPHFHKTRSLPNRMDGKLDYDEIRVNKMGLEFSLPVLDKIGHDEPHLKLNHCFLNKKKKRSFSCSFHSPPYTVVTQTKTSSLPLLFPYQVPVKAATIDTRNKFGNKDDPTYPNITGSADLLEKLNKDYDDSSVDNGLFEAGIQDSLMVFFLILRQDGLGAASLKEKTNELRHSLRDSFNINQGRWCSEY